jgi:hypothetical protein
MVAMALKAVCSCDGVSTRQHNEPAGSQDVWHYHLHVTPRYEDDGFYATQREFMPVDQRARHAEKLRGYLQQSESAKHPRRRWQQLLFAVGVTLACEKKAEPLGDPEVRFCGRKRLAGVMLFSCNGALSA